MAFAQANIFCVNCMLTGLFISLQNEGLSSGLCSVNSSNSDFSLWYSLHQLTISSFSHSFPIPIPSTPILPPSSHASLHLFIYFSYLLAEQYYPHLQSLIRHLVVSMEQTQPPPRVVCTQYCLVQGHNCYAQGRMSCMMDMWAQSKDMTSPTCLFGVRTLI